jgi:hypothetical protein
MIPGKKKAVTAFKTTRKQLPCRVRSDPDERYVVLTKVINTIYLIPFLCSGILLASIKYTIAMVPVKLSIAYAIQKSKI